MKTIVITGASSGIGKAAAESFLKDGHRVIAVVRTPDLVSDLVLKYQNHFLVYQQDLSQIEKMEGIKSFLIQHQISGIDVLVNNAGVAYAAPFALQEFSEIENVINLNVLSVMKMTQVLIPLLAQNNGRIVNISSVSGENGTPFLASYCASKYAIEGFSESIRRELKIYGITVCIVGPGSVKTPIWQKGFQKIKDKYDQTIYKNSFKKFMEFASNEEMNGLDVNVVVKDIQHAALSNAPKIRYYPIPRKFRNYYLAKLIPKKKMDEINCKILGLGEIKKN